MPPSQVASSVHFRDMLTSLTDLALHGSQLMYLPGNTKAQAKCRKERSFLPGLLFAIWIWDL